MIYIIFLYNKRQKGEEITRNNLVKIFEDTIICNYDEGNTINSLIKLNIINLNDLTEEIIKTKNIEYIFKLALYIKNAPIDKLADTMIKTGNIEYIYFFAKDIENAPINKLAKAIIETNDAQHIRLFFKDIKSKLITRPSNIPEIAYSDEDIELENYDTLLSYTKENNYEQIKENKEEFATLFSDNKSKKLIKRK